MRRRYRSRSGVGPSVVRELEALRADGPLKPVVITGRTIAHTFWGKAWCKNLESYSDFANRLPRGRTYARGRAILDLRIEEGHVHATVRGQRLYRVEIRIDTISAKRWAAVRAACGGKIESLLELLEGRLSEGVLGVVTRPGEGLFPTPGEIHLQCSCPDWAVMCKHVAATLYGVGARLDEAPEMLFSLRGVDPGELMSGAVALGVPDRPERGRRLDVDDLSEIFGVEIDFTFEPGNAEEEAITEQVVDRLAEGDATARGLARALGLDEERVLTELLALEELGILIRTGSGRRAKWALG